MHLSLIVGGQQITTNHLRGVTGWSKVSKNCATMPRWTIAKVAIRDTSQNWGHLLSWVSQSFVKDGSCWLEWVSLFSTCQETPPDLSILEHIRKITRHIVSSFFEYGCGLVIFLCFGSSIAGCNDCSGATGPTNDVDWASGISWSLSLRNLIAIGFEAQLSLEGHEYDNAFWFAGVERMFLCIYCVEALLRAFSFGWVIMFDVWFILDLALVLIGALALVIVPLLASNTEDMKGFEKLLVVRSLRLLRLMRVLRMVNHFKIIWRLVYGFLTAWDTLFSSAALILLTLFIFSCIAIEVIAKDVDLLASALADRWLSLTIAWWQVGFSKRFQVIERYLQLRWYHAADCGKLLCGCGAIHADLGSVCNAGWLERCVLPIDHRKTLAYTVPSIAEVEIYQHFSPLLSVISA